MFDHDRDGLLSVDDEEEEEEEDDDAVMLVL